MKRILAPWLIVFLIASSYCLASGVLGGLSNNEVTTNKIANGAVTSPKLAVGAAVGNLTDNTIPINRIDSDNAPYVGACASYSGLGGINWAPCSSSGGGGSGDVTGPSSSANSEIVRFNGTTGKTIKATVSHKLEYLERQDSASDSSLLTFSGPNSDDVGEIRFSGVFPTGFVYGGGGQSLSLGTYGTGGAGSQPSMHFTGANVSINDSDLSFANSGTGIIFSGGASFKGAGANSATYAGNLDLTGNLTLATDPGTTGQVLSSNGAGNPPTWENAGSGSGDVTGPGTTVTDNALVLWNGTSGTDVDDSGSTAITYALNGAYNEFRMPNGEKNQIFFQYGNPGYVYLYTNTDDELNIIAGNGGSNFARARFNYTTATEAFEAGAVISFDAPDITFTGASAFAGNVKFNNAVKYNTALLGAGNDILTVNQTLIVKNSVTGGGDLATLPDVAGNDGLRMVIKCPACSVVDTYAISGDANIDGAATQTIITANGVIVLFVADGQWFIESENL